VGINDAANQEARYMTDTVDSEHDVALDALDTLSEVAASSIDGLTEVHAQLTQVRRRRRRGWTWRRIVSSEDSPNPLANVTGIAANLAIASAEFRRGLAHALRNEGMPLTRIAPLLNVSRQRIGALLRPRRHGGGTS
jgi:hypothetical protein